MNENLSINERINLVTNTLRSKKIEIIGLNFFLEIKICNF